MELLGRMFGFVEKLMDEVRRQNDALAKAVESLNAAVEHLQSPVGNSPAKGQGGYRGRSLIPAGGPEEQGCGEEREGEEPGQERADQLLQDIR